MISRGEVVIVDFRPSHPSAGVRPALIIQNDRDNARMGNTIVVQLTTNTRRASEDTQLLVDPKHPDWLASGLRYASAVNCSNLATVPQSDVVRRLGRLSPATMQQIDRRLKVALGIP